MAITSNRIPNNPSAANPTTSKAAGRNVGSLSNYGQSLPVKQLSVGQVLKGEVTDLRNNEIVVTLDDNTKVAARLENGLSLSIGDTAAFRVKDISISHIILEAIPKSELAVANSTINKALDEAGLPKNEKNILVVRELMNQGMPINKQAIQNILIQSYTHKTVDISTLVLMNKNRIPLNNGAAEQMQNHIDGQHPMAADIFSLATEVGTLLQNFASYNTSENCLTFGKELFSIILPSKSDIIPDTLSAPEPDISFLTPNERTELISTLDMFSLPESAKDAILDGSLPLRDAIVLTKENINLAMTIDENHLTELKQHQEAELLKGNIITSPAEMEAELNSLTKTIEAFDIPSVGKLFDEYYDLQRSNNEIGAILDTEGRENLSELLKDFPLSPKLKELIDNGEAPVKDVLNTLKNTMPLTDDKHLKALFQSTEFKDILQAGLTANWTLTPKQLKNPDAVKNFYDTLYEQTQRLSELSKTPLLSGLLLKGDLETPAQNLKQNMDFMNILNQMFPYVELPLRLQDQITHGDLYVYTKKQSLKKNPSNLSVLLHLDMESLGPLDIKLNLNGNVIDSTFYFSDKDAMNLISNNIILLEDALVEKGFLLKTAMEMQAEPQNIVKEFIEKDTKETPMQRYTFDIRA